MFFCETIAAMLVCTNLSPTLPGVIPSNFDLATVPGSQSEPKLERAIVFFIVPEPLPPRWTLVSVDSHWEHTFTTREEFSPGLKVYPGRVRLRFTFDDAGTYVI